MAEKQTLKQMLKFILVSLLASAIQLVSVNVLFSTWLQGVVAGALLATENQTLRNLAPTVAMACAGMLQMIVLFPLEKFVLLKEKKG